MRDDKLVSFLKSTHTHRCAHDDVWKTGLGNESTNLAYTATKAVIKTRGRLLLGCILLFFVCFGIHKWITRIMG